MADFKGIGGEHGPNAVMLGGLEFPPLDEQLIAQSRAAFGEFNIHEQGGLMVAPSGQVFELRAPDWEVNGDPSLLARASALPITAEETGDGFEFTWHGEEFNPLEPTLGGEFEISPDLFGFPFEISSDGETVVWPDGSTTTLDEVGLDPEALKAMLEYKTHKAHGFAEHRANVIAKTYEVEQLLDAHGLNHAGLSLFSEAIDSPDASDLRIVRRILSGMIAREFGVMSTQLHVQMLNSEAGQFALNVYQEVQAVFALMTAASPIRDGSFETTIGEHYQTANGYGRRPESTEFGPEYIDPYLDADDYLTRYEAVVPWDWRELARAKGSPSGGAMETPAPVDFKEFLQQGDQKLRNGDIVTLGRTLGWHADRHRLDYGTNEINNMSTAGGNLYKTLAAHEIVSNFIVALQLHYMSMSPELRNREVAMQRNRTEIGHINNFILAMNGGDIDLRFRRSGGNSVTPEEMLTSVLEFTDKYLPGHISSESRLEALSTVGTREQDRPYETAVEVFEAFFQPLSSMTATDALHYAHKIDPSLSVVQLKRLFSEARRNHVYEVHAQKLAVENGSAVYAGALALAVESV